MSGSPGPGAKDRPADPFPPPTMRHPHERPGQAGRKAHSATRIRQRVGGHLGHAKRNEFQIDGQTLIGFRGSQSIDGPSAFPKASMEVMEA
ncbi:MAG: hypothetical protein NZ990_12290 [Myxococcota bacterium]|nr:hypothetical protein [Myxococcota bacterium]